MKNSKTSEELKIIKELESGAYTSLKGEELVEMKNMLKSASANTIKKRSAKKSISIRVLEDDIERLKAKALSLGMPYQTLISSILHQYTQGKLESKMP